MSPTTDDPNDPGLRYGVDEAPARQSDAYLVLSDEERAKGFVRPLRTAYLHVPCGTVTTMNARIAETYARDPKFYGATYCVTCAMHRPVGENGEFVWLIDGERSSEKVGT